MKPIMPFSIVILLELAICVLMFIYWSFNSFCPMSEIDEYPQSPCNNNLDIKSSVLALWWAIWNARSEAIFRGKVVKPLHLSKYAMSLLVPIVLSNEKVINTTSFEIQNFIPVKANGSVIIMCNAIFLKKRRQELLWRGNVL